MSENVSNSPVATLCALVTEVCTCRTDNTDMLCKCSWGLYSVERKRNLSFVLHWGHDVKLSAVTPSNHRHCEMLSSSAPKQTLPACGFWKWRKKSIIPLWFLEMVDELQKVRESSLIISQNFAGIRKNIYWSLQALKREQERDREIELKYFQQPLYCWILSSFTL